jgi:hypothetical protein
MTTLANQTPSTWTRDIEIDYSDRDATPTVTPVQPAIVSPVGDWASPHVNDAARDLAAQESALLADNGIGESELYFDAGTALADIGHSNLESYAEEYRKMSTPQTAIDAFKSVLALEARKDRVANVTGLRVDADGLLAAKEHAIGGKGLRLEDNAWRQLATIAGTPNVNAGLGTLKSNTDRRVRTRTLPGKERSIYGMVSTGPKGYSVLDGGEVADLVLRGLRDSGQDTGAKGEVVYDANSTRYKIRTIVQAPIDIMQFRGVGRVHQIFLDISGGDNGMASVEGSMGAIRIRCMNASLSQANGTKWSRVHKGNMASDVRAMIPEMVRKFGVVAADMQAVWANAAAHYYLDVDGSNLSPAEAITRLVAGGYVPTGGKTVEQAIDAYTQAWKAEESPSSAAGIVMAIQRAAHESTWSTKWSTAEIEESASNLLYSKVYTLAEVR